MRVLTPLLTTVIALSIPAIASAAGFKSDLATTITGPIKVEIVVSEDLAHRADNLPKKLSDRGSRSRLSSAFSSNGKYGQKDIDERVEEMTEELAEDFAKYGVETSETAPTLFRVTLELVKPNRPTFNQLRTDSTLSFQSFGIGGAEITAELINAAGETIGTMDYDYYSNFNDYGFRPIGIWTDTDRSISRFSKKATKKLAAMGAGGNS